MVILGHRYLNFRTMSLYSFLLLIELFVIFNETSNGVNTREIELRQGGTVTNTKSRQSRVQPQCLPNEYGPTCSYCLPSDSCKDGHYTCDINTGSKVCIQGYHGEDCKLLTNLLNEYHVTCPENTCRNGGTCNSGRCCCREGFTGILCEIEIIECKNHSCLNGGICKDLIGKFECLCKPSFHGDHCELPIDPHSGTTPSLDSSCQSRPCKNNGTCFEDAFFTYCVCPTYYTGENCEKRLGSPSSLSTSCQPNYYGNGCKMYCKPQDECHGHFVCDKATGDKICQSGWHGLRCDTRILPQSVDPMCPKHGCKNDGQCFNEQCCCRHNYTGDYCQVESIGCLSNPCQNNATCVNQGNGYACLCQSNFTGQDCETDITIAASTVTPTHSNSFLNTLTLSASSATRPIPEHPSKYSFQTSPASVTVSSKTLTSSSQITPTSSTHSAIIYTDASLFTPYINEHSSVYLLTLLDSVSSYSASPTTSSYSTPTFNTNTLTYDTYFQPAPSSFRMTQSVMPIPFTHLLVSSSSSFMLSYSHVASGVSLSYHTAHTAHRSLQVSTSSEFSSIIHASNSGSTKFQSTITKVSDTYSSSPNPTTSGIPRLLTSEMSTIETVNNVVPTLPLHFSETFVPSTDLFLSNIVAPLKTKLSSAPSTILESGTAAEGPHSFKTSIPFIVSSSLISLSHSSSLAYTPISFAPSETPSDRSQQTSDFLQSTSVDDLKSSLVPFQTVTSHSNSKLKTSLTSSQGQHSYSSDLYNPGHSVSSSSPAISFSLGLQSRTKDDNSFTVTDYSSHTTGINLGSYSQKPRPTPTLVSTVLLNTEIITTSYHAAHFSSVEISFAESTSILSASASTYSLPSSVTGNTPSTYVEITNSASVQHQSSLVSTVDPSVAAMSTSFTLSSTENLPTLPSNSQTLSNLNERRTLSSEQHLDQTATRVFIYPSGTFSEFGSSGKLTATTQNRNSDMIESINTKGTFNPLQSSSQFKANSISDTNKYSYSHTTVQSILTTSSRIHSTSALMKSSSFVTKSSDVDLSTHTMLIPELTDNTVEDKGISKAWQIALIVIACALFLIAIVFLVVFMSIRQRRKDSRTITHSPSDIQDYSKEHFSTQPDFNNPAYEIDENDSDDDSVKYDMYVVNK